MGKFNEVTVICSKDHVFEPGVCIACERDRYQRALERVERDGVGASRVLFDERLAGSVDELGGLSAERKVGADDAVVRQVFSNGNA